MPTFKLTLAYDGTAYAGWQVQPGQVTIQGALEDAVAKITGRSVRMIASGRTDAGVHALAQVASFHVDTRLPAHQLQAAINAHTPHDIWISELIEVPPGFHAIRDAVRKRYRYVIQDGPQRDVFSRAYAWHVRQPLDARAMRDAARMLLGRHDCASFQTAGSERVTTVRTITHASIERQSGWHPAGRIVFEIEADGFLYNMVRNIVGTLVDVGRGERPVAWVADVLAARDRTVAGMTAPPQGLFLVRVDYEAPAGPASPV